MPVYVSRSLRRKLLDYFLPSTIEAVLYVALALFLLIVSRAPTIISLLSGGQVPEPNQQLVSDNMTVVINQLTHGLGQITIFCFWTFLGCFIYSLYWFIYTLLHNLHQHRQTSKNIADQAARRDYWQTAVSNQLAFVSIVLTIPGYIFFFLLEPWPVASRVALLRAANFNWYNLLTALFIVLGIALKLYVLHILVRIFKYAVRTKGFRHHLD